VQQNPKTNVATYISDEEIREVLKNAPPKILNGPGASGKVKLSSLRMSAITDHVDYLSIRPDPDHLLPLGYVNPAIRDMKP